MAQDALLALHELLEEVCDLHLDRLLVAEEHVGDEVVEEGQLRRLLLLAEHKLRDVLQLHVRCHVEGDYDLEAADLHQVDAPHARLAAAAVALVRSLEQQLNGGGLEVRRLFEVRLNLLGLAIKVCL